MFYVFVHEYVGFREIMIQKKVIQSNLDISNSDIIEFCESRSVYLNQKYILIAFSNLNLTLETFFTNLNYPKCKLLCTSDNLNL